MKTQNGTYNMELVMHLPTNVDYVDSKNRLADFVAILAKDLADNEEEWTNPTLEQFLRALGAWLRRMDTFYESTDQPVVDRPSWKTVAEMLLVARVFVAPHLR